MLVLSRKVDERVVITAGEDRIVVTLVEIRGDKVRIGFEAPPHVAVHRENIQALIDQGSADRKQQELARKIRTTGSE